MHSLVVDIDALAWNEEAGEFEKEHVKAGAAFGRSQAHVDLGWVGEVQFVGADPVRIERLAEVLLTAARDLRIVQLDELTEQVGLKPFTEDATTEASAA